MARPRSASPKGLGRFCKERTKRIRQLLAEIAVTYSDVDSYIETRADELASAMDELDQDIDDAVSEGRCAS